MKVFTVLLSQEETLNMIKMQKIMLVSILFKTSLCNFIATQAKDHHDLKA